MKYVGVDIGGTNLKAGLTDENGQLLAVQKMKVAAITDQQSLAWTIVSLTQELAKCAGVPLNEIASVGVGVPGTVEIRSGSIGYTCNLPLQERAAAKAVPPLSVHPAVYRERCKLRGTGGILCRGRARE